MKLEIAPSMAAVFTFRNIIYSPTFPFIFLSVFLRFFKTRLDRSRSWFNHTTLSLDGQDPFFYFLLSRFLITFSVERFIDLGEFELRS